MGVFSKRNDVEEPGGGGSSLHLDLDERYCPTCRRALPPWQPTCPTDGGEGLPLADLPSRMPLPGGHLLEADPRSDPSPPPAGGG